MGSKFMEKHKRKSLLAALLLLFRGRARYVVLLVMVLGASAPFVVSQDMLYRLVQFAPVSYILRATGLHSVITALDSSYSNDILRAAINRAMHDSDQDSVWNSFLRGMSGTMTGAGAGSSLAMLRGGEDYYRAGEPGKAGKRKPGEVAGAVSDEEKARGAGADAVDFEDYLAGAGGPGDGSGFGYMSGGGAGSFGGALGSGSPFMNRTILGKGPGIGGAADGMYGGAMNQAASRVPVAGNPKPVTGKRMGRVSGFSWRNAGYRQGGGDPGSRINKQGAMFRLAETFTMTGAAYKNPTASSEYQASHVGATYDGNAVGLQEIQTDATPPPVPDNSWTSDIMQGAAELTDLAKECSRVASEQTTHISENSDKMDKIAKSMGKPPKCCNHGAVNRWNGKIEQIKALCMDNNARNSLISAACQTVDTPVNCNNHNKAKIKKCSKLKCWIGIILAILLIIVGAFLLGPIGIALIVAGASLLISQLVPGIFGMLLGILAGMLAVFYLGATLAQQAIASALKTVAGAGSDGGEK
ncbi:MAG: hypothetical protein FD189_560 [Elusimicrobia bacterium]|nr:MAG: hypothetical protein FD154_559 [Elusimicrobiota bacterium]KAF0157292.1 MAG: hypothetical protein FD189_560 [Elusimicrobiota bacterium]